MSLILNSFSGTKRILFKFEKELIVRISDINKKSFLPFLHSFLNLYSNFIVSFHKRILFVSEKEFRIGDINKNSLVLSGKFNRD